MGALGYRFVNSTVRLELSNPPPESLWQHVRTKRFPGRSVRLNNCTINLFRSGKAVIVGCKSPDDVVKAVNEAGRRWGKIKKYEIRNVVGSVNCGGNVNLYRLSRIFQCNYSPDMYNGLIVTLSSGARCIIFHSGKAIVTGCRDFESCGNSINILLDVLDREKWEHLLLCQVADDTQ
jgi:TATA-box binding protein (TBP) (component of TFIID and TFIIIB)